MAKINSKYISTVIEQFERTFEKKLYDVYIGYRKNTTNDDVTYYTAKPEEWEEVIDKLLEKGIVLEEFELCSKIQDLKPKILDEAKIRLESKEKNESKEKVD